MRKIYTQSLAQKEATVWKKRYEDIFIENQKLKEQYERTQVSFELLLQHGFEKFFNLNTKYPQYSERGERIW